ncbi:MAG: type IV pilus assembly protein PilM [Desulfobacterales bacterium]|uniref:Type IV pilus assembly protein PilM n=1 Tax=Candidatus Desulfatibia vada TaxID=2841696 RepID=A0A8J6TLY3_9BACT|nr:type IV pilus assembly protein PilM [Candidatus Desulfatibia vada]
MFFKKKTHLVGLDIGSSAIKAAEVIETKTENVLHNFGMLKIAPGLIEEGTIKDHDAVSAAIRELFSANNIKNKNVAISIGGYSVIVKKISVQTMTEDELQETIHFEAEQYIPFDISDVNLDFQILGENDQNPNQMNVLLVAAKKEMVSDYIHLIELAGLHTVILDIDSFALQNIFEFNYATEEESVALIDIGASKTSLNILKGYSSVFMRDVSLGCGQINQQIVSLADCSIEEAEKIKLSEQSAIISAKDLANIVSSVVSDWTTEIRRAIDFFYSTYPDDHISKIILSGGGANITEFRQLLSDEISTEVEIINPFDKFSIESSGLDSSYLEKIAPQAAICMGLAIRKVE